MEILEAGKGICYDRVTESETKTGGVPYGEEPISAGTAAYERTVWL